MNPIDTAISWFSPEKALARAKARAILGQVEKLAYDGAKPGRRTDGWFRPGTSANAETSASLAKLRDGARDLVRNTPGGTSALLQFRTKIVGTGIRPQARTDNPKVNEILDKTFEKWAKQTGYYRMQSLSVATIVESGEALLRFRTRRPEDGLVVPLWPVLLEPDYLDHTKTIELTNGYVIQGVEFDALDRQVAVWLWPRHPGDSINTNVFKRGGTGASYRVPLEGAGLDGVSRGFREDRAGQIRGVTWFASVMTAMWDLAGYGEAERFRKRLEACLAAFVISPESDGGSPALGLQRSDGNGDLVEDFRPGMIGRLRPGEDVKIAEPKAAGGYAEYTRREDRMIAVGMGLLYELMTGDLSQVNYSSYRGGLVGLRDFIEWVQYFVMIPFICDPTWTRFVRGCKLVGLIPNETPEDEVEWAPPAFDLLDRLAEAEADEKEVRIGTSTWDQAVARRGLDPNKQAEQIEARNKDFDARGIILDSDPRMTNGRGMVQIIPAQEENQ